MCGLEKLSLEPGCSCPPLQTQGSRGCLGPRTQTGAQLHAGALRQPRPACPGLGHMAKQHAGWGRGFGPSAPFHWLSELPPRRHPEPPAATRPPVRLRLWRELGLGCEVRTWRHCWAWSAWDRPGPFPLQEIPGGPWRAGVEGGGAVALRACRAVSPSRPP